MSLFAGLVGIIDLLAAAALIGIYLEHPILHLQAGMGLAITMKGLIFFSDVLSWIDIVIGISMFVFFWFAAPKLALAMGIWLIYKGIYSWF
jgi:hypothetical protein